jgi:hypothetical protein
MKFRKLCFAAEVKFFAAVEWALSKTLFRFLTPDDEPDNEEIPQ